MHPMWCMAEFVGNADFRSVLINTNALCKLSLRGVPDLGDDEAIP